MESRGQERAQMEFGHEESGDWKRIREAGFVLENRGFVRCVLAEVG